MLSDSIKLVNQMPEHQKQSSLEVMQQSIYAEKKLIKQMKYSTRHSPDVRRENFKRRGKTISTNIYTPKKN